MQERHIELQQWLAARADGKAVLLYAARPGRKNRVGKRFGARKASAARTVGADKVCIAEPTHRARAILLASGPEIAAGKP